MINKDYKVIKDFPEYMVTYDGEIWSYKNKYKCRKGLRKLKPRISRNGYAYVDLVDGDKKKRYSIHRLVAFQFCNKLDVKPSMLLKHRNINGYILHKIR